MSYNYFSCVSKMEKEKIKIKKWGGVGGGGCFSRKAIAIWVNTLQEKLVIGKPCLHTCTALFVT